MLVLRHFELLANAEPAHALTLSVSGTKQRHVRAQPWKTLADPRYFVSRSLED